jgi:hypothetical protein
MLSQLHPSLPRTFARRSLIIQSRSEFSHLAAQDYTPFVFEQSVLKQGRVSRPMLVMLAADKVLVY